MFCFVLLAIGCLILFVSIFIAMMEGEFSVVPILMGGVLVCLAVARFQGWISKLPSGHGGGGGGGGP